LKKIITILGARPQFVKAAVLSRIINEHKEINEVIIHTGQHYDVNMSDVFFQEMNIPKPDYTLDINRMSHAAMTGKMLTEIEKILQHEKPLAVIVYGDTNSTLAGALAASKIHIPVVHIEAGLRSFNLKMPEEINRILTDRISSLLLCPTQTAVDNLLREGFSHFPGEIILSGDIMKDAVEYYGETCEEKANIYRRLAPRSDSFILSTIHRQENTDDPKVLRRIFDTLNEINKKIPVLMPLHPRTGKILRENGIGYEFTTFDPVGYFDMLALLKNCKMVITDSGGLQKEAFFNRKPVIIVREETEWVELVDHGYATIAGTQTQNIIDAVAHYKRHKPDYSMNLYGEQVGIKIYNAINTLTE
jgi:UDP-GlcNAc3NAcA epimerase